MIAGGIHQQIGMSTADFTKLADLQIDQFEYSGPLSAIGLDQVILVHYAVSDEYLAKVCGVEALTNLSGTTLYEENGLPSALGIVQCNLGCKYKNRMISDVRKNYAHEHLGVIKEGLFAYLYWGNSLLRECFMDFPGSLSADGHTPYLLLRGDKPFLVADEKDVLDPWGTPEKGETVARPRAYPDFGSVTVCRNF